MQVSRAITNNIGVANIQFLLVNKITSVCCLFYKRSGNLAVERTNVVRISCERLRNMRGRLTYLLHCGFGQVPQNVDKFASTFFCIWLFLVFIEYTTFVQSKFYYGE